RPSDPRPGSALEDSTERPLDNAVTPIADPPAPSIPARRTPRARTTRADPLSEEASRLAKAIALSRKSADPAGSLRELDAYRVAYPDAHFGDEARMLRIEDLLALDRKREALAELTPEKIPSLARSEELWVIRAEILLELHREREALEAFDAALRIAKTDSLIERAL